MRQVTQYRPVFAAFYFGGFEGTTPRHLDGKNISTEVDGVKDWSQDLQRIKYYLDPVINHALFGFRTHWPRFEWPNLMDNDPEEIEQWKHQARKQLTEVFKTYRDNGLQLVASTPFFVSMGTNYAPSWYTEVPDWSELTLDGKLPQARVFAEGREGIGIASLAHPELYRVAERCAELLRELGLDEEEIFVGFQPANEPGIGLREFGGNPYTRDQFREFLKREDGDLAGFNKLLDTSYESFDEVDIAQPSPVMKAWTDRFRAWLVSGYYQKRLGDIFRRHFPGWQLYTRFQTWNSQGHRGDMSYLLEATTDYSGVSYYPRAYIDSQGREIKNRMGFLTVLGSRLAAFERPVALTEFGIRKGIEPSTVVTESIRPYEVFNIVYRSLAYNVRFISLFWYTHPVIGPNWANLYGMHLSRFPETLKAFRQVRDELERIRPYDTFGKVYQNELGVLISRNAIHYPGVGELYYEKVQQELAKVWEQPKLSQYDLVDEHSPSLEEHLARYRGIVVLDACLRPETRQVLGRLARQGVKILAVGAPQYVDDRYRQATPPDVYPIVAVRGGSFTENLKRSSVKVRSRPHTLLAGRKEWTLEQVVPVEPRGDSSVLLQQAGSRLDLGYVNGRVAYISGIPAGVEEWRDLLMGFARWTGATVEPIVVSQFENAIVVQNFRPELEDLREQSLGEKNWIGQVLMKDRSWKGQLREMRRDLPWLAYTRGEEGIQVEGLRLATMEVQVIQKRQGEELPHFEGTPAEVGFLEFTLGWDHVVGKFEVSQAGEKVLRYAAGKWASTPVAWQVNEVNSPHRIAEGSTAEIRFRAQPGKQYYLILRRLEEHNPECPVCSQGRMM